MSLPLHRLPSLESLRGFVAVGRRMSITQAARDLCLSQSAVSRQVRGLEDALGVRLLARGHRALAFTPEGERLFRAADAAFGQLQAVFADLGRTHAGRPVTLGASVGVAGLWLLPRLGDFQASHPDIALRIAADNRVVDLAAEGVDLAIRYCAEAAAPAGAERLFDEMVAPVAHPTLGLVGNVDGGTLAAQTLLEYDDPRRPWLQWRDWLAERGAHKSAARAMLRFNQYDQVIQAAVAGRGVALGRLRLIDSLLGSGQLRVLAEPVPTGQAYWLVRAGDEPDTAVARVVDWLRQQARGEGFACVPGMDTRR